MSKKGVGIINNILSGGEAKKDIEELTNLLDELSRYRNELAGKYHIRADLVDATNRKYSLAQQFDSDLATLRSEIKKATEAKEAFDTYIKETDDFSEKIFTIKEKLDAPSNDGELYGEKLEKLLSVNYIQNIETQADQISSLHDNFYENNKEGEDSKSEKLENIFNKAIELDEWLNLSSEGDETKYKKIKQKYNEVVDIHNKLVSGYIKTNEKGEEITVNSIFSSISNLNTDFNNYYTKVFGKDDDESDLGLKGEIEARLTDLNDVEIEARKVVDLSSDAGLAGGFVLNGKQAKINKIYSVVAFVISLGFLVYLNRDLAKVSIELITFEMISVRVILNMPLVWIAVVANINLNKYSRLEAEYAHKESLAKSFERYKNQIKGLENSDESQRLLTKLMKTNIKAFDKNAAETMVLAKSDMPSTDNLTNDGTNED